MYGNICYMLCVKRELKLLGISHVYIILGYYYAFFRWQLFLRVTPYMFLSQYVVNMDEQIIMAALEVIVKWRRKFYNT